LVVWRDPATGGLGRGLGGLKAGPGRQLTIDALYGLPGPGRVAVCCDDRIDIARVNTQQQNPKRLHHTTSRHWKFSMGII
jgi:hypothetical protein